MRGFALAPLLESMEPFLLSTALVALAEIGDKTQWLALMLAARWRRPWPIVAGIVVATVLNHALAGVVGVWLAGVLGPDGLRWVLGLGFLAMALWMLWPDAPPEGDVDRRLSHLGVFAATAAAFFVAEMGDKTQVATVALAARWDGALIAVVAGTTLGMVLANAPVVWLGDRLVRRLPVRQVHIAAALLMAALGIATLLGVGQGWLR